MLFIKRKLDSGANDGPDAAAEPRIIEGEVVIEPQAVEPLAEAPPPVRKSLFGKKPKPAGNGPTDAEVVKPDTATSSKKARGLLGRLGCSNKPASPEPVAGKPAPSADAPSADAPSAATGKPSKKEKAPKPEKPKKAPRTPSGRGRKPGYVAVVLDGTGDTVWWAVAGNALQRMPEAPTTGVAVVFSRDDTRIAAEKAVSYQDALGLAFQETGEDAAVANASKAHGVVYATSAARIAESALKIIPGLLVLEAVAKANAMQGPDTAGFELALDGGGTALLVLAALSAKDGIGKHQWTLNPENRQFSIDQFVAQQKGATGGVTLFGLSELLNAAATVPGYPTEPLVLWGIPRSKAWLGAVALSGLLAAAGVGVYVYIEGATLLMEQRAEEAKKAEKTAQRAAALFVENRVAGLVEKASLDVGQALEQAAAVWVPRSVVRLDSKLSDGTTLTVVFSPSGPKTSKQYLFSATKAEIDSVLGRTSVGGCNRLSLSINGATNEITAVYQCPNTGGPIPGYGLD